MSDSKIQIEVAANTKQAVESLSRIDNSLESLSKHSNSLGVKFIKLGQTFTAFKSIADVVKSLANVANEYIQIYAVQEQAEARLQATFKVTENQILKRQLKMSEKDKPENVGLRC